MSESMSEMSEDAAVNGDGLLDTVFDAICELAGEDGRDWVPVRQIQAQTYFFAAGTTGRNSSKSESVWVSSAGMTRDSRWHSARRLRHKSRSAVRLERYRDRHGLGAGLACPCLFGRAVQRFFLNGMVPEQR